MIWHHGQAQSLMCSNTVLVTRLVSMVGMPWLVHGAMSGGNKHLTEIWCRASQSSDQGPTGFTAVMSA